MKRLIFLLWLVLLLVPVYAVPEQVTVYRQLMDKALEDKAAAEQFCRHMAAEAGQEQARVRGYRAMSQILMCRHVSGPFSKLEWFRKGKQLLEQAIAQAPANAELRYFRFVTQQNSPSLLGYKSDLDADKDFLVRFLRDQEKQAGPDKDLCGRARRALLESDYCSEKEREWLTQTTW